MFLDLFTNPLENNLQKETQLKRLIGKNYKMTLDIKNMIGR